MASKNKLPAEGLSHHVGEHEPLVPPLDAITKLELFLEKHWRMVVAVLVVVVTAVVIFFYFKYKREDAMTQSNNAFTAAVTRADFEGVVKAHPGTAAAGSALYEIADRQIAGAELEAGQASLEQFVDDYPDHKLRENALLALGGISEKQGELDKASDYFQQVIDAGDKTSLGPLATICKTEVLVAKGELEQALEMYESFAVNNVGSPFIAKAEERMAAVEAKIARKGAPQAPVEPAPEEPAAAEIAPTSGTDPAPIPGIITPAPGGGANESVPAEDGGETAPEAPVESGAEPGPAGEATEPAGDAAETDPAPSVVE